MNCYKGLLRLVMCFLFCALVGCSTLSNEEKYHGMSENQLYQGGQVALARGHYDTATGYFDALQAQYPFGDKTEQANLDLIYAYYKSGDYASAVAASDRFIHLYPRAQHVDYAYYLKGLADFYADKGFFQRISPVSPADRDLAPERQAFNDFSTLIELFPNSPYAADSKQRLIYLRNIFAQHELKIANFYFVRHVYLATANRASEIVKHYQGTPQVGPALVLLVKSYRALKLESQANQALAVLKLNYPKLAKEQHLS